MLKLKEVFFIAFIALSGISKTDKIYNNENFSGSWVYVKNNANTSFDLTLSTTDKNVKGTHCFVGSKGNRIDCSEEKFSINGTLQKNGEFSGKFKSYYNDKSYDLKMNFNKDTLIFSLVMKGEALFYPQQIKFLRDK